MGKRIAYLEGMRGICAIAVFNCHMVPWLLPGVMQTHLYKLFMKTPVFMMQSGAFGVSYFFVLSGYTFMLRAEDPWWGEGKKIIANILKRYLRLIPTIFFCNLFAWLLLEFKILYYVPGTIINGIPSFSRTVENINAYKVISDSLFTVFIRGSSFVAPFWTIKYEFLGFLLSIILANVFTHISYKRKIIVFVLLFAVFFFFENGYFFINILLGLLLFELQRHYTYSKKYQKISGKSTFYYAIFLSQMIVIWAQSQLNIMKNYAYFCGFFFFLLLWEINIKRDGKIKKILESRIIQFFGKISFQIYGLHFLIIRSLGAFLANIMNSNSIYVWIFVYCFTFSVTIVLSVILNKINIYIQNNINSQILKTIEKNFFK